MQKIIVLILILLSEVLFSTSKITEKAKPVATCNVWGFLKYYHSEVANGEFKWHNQFLEKLSIKNDYKATKSEFLERALLYIKSTDLSS